MYSLYHGASGYQVGGLFVWYVRLDPRELFRSTVFDDLHRVCLGTDGNANHLHPTPFRDADVNAFKQGNYSIDSKCPFGGKATVLLEFMIIPMLTRSRCRKGTTTSTVSDVTSTCGQKRQGEYY